MTDGEVEAVDGLFFEKDGGLVGDERFHGAAAFVGDDGSATGLSFERDDAEVFFAGEKKVAAAAVVVADDVVGLPAEKLDVGSGDGFEFGGFGADTNDDEGSFGVGVGLNDEVDAFVGNKGRDDEVKVFAGLIGRGVEVGVDGWVHDVGGSSVEDFDAAADMMADGDEAIDALGGTAIPDAKGGEKRPEGELFDGARSEVFVVEAPGITHGGKAVAEMAFGLFSGEGFGGAMAGADEEVDRRGRPGTDGEGEKGKVVAIGLCDVGYALKPGGAEIVTVNGVGDGFLVMKKAVDGSVWEAVGEEFEDFFAAAHTGEPVVGEGGGELAPRWGVFGHGEEDQSEEAPMRLG